MDALGAHSVCDSSQAYVNGKLVSEMVLMFVVRHPGGVPQPLPLPSPEPIPLPLPLPLPLPFPMDDSCPGLFPLTYGPHVRTKKLVAIRSTLPGEERVTQP